MQDECACWRALRAGATVALDLTLDKSALTDLGSGYVDLQLNPGASDALLVSTHVYNVRTDGMLGETVNTGVVTGSLSQAPLPVLYNTTIFNDMFQQIV